MAKPPSSPRTADEPAFWFQFEVTPAKLAVGRVILFGVLALDALLQIHHAPRYGAGGFNVAQLPGLDAVAPGRGLFEVAELVNAYLFVLAACGAATRIVVPIATAIYAWLYFGSQLDSYQHHYLIALLLVIACFVPWQQRDDAKPDAAVRSWAVRLLLVQLAILYAWAAISKMSAAWTSGVTLDGQIHGTLRHAIDATIGIRATADLVLGTELVLAATVWQPRLWWLALPLGLALHVSIVISGLEIGLFAWLMIGLYTWIVPDRAWIWLARTRASRALGAGLRAIARAFARARSAPAGVLGIVAIALSRYDHVVAAGAFATLALLALLAFGDRRTAARLGAAHVVALALWLAGDRIAGIPEAYYRLWGGTARRLGDHTAEERAYRGLLAISPGDATASYHLGELLLARPGVDDAGAAAGLEYLHRAERAEPGRARALVAEARWLASRGRHDEALAKARDATLAEPGDRDARALLDQLAGKPRAPAGAPGEPGRGPR